MLAGYVYLSFENKTYNFIPNEKLKILSDLNQDQVRTKVCFLTGLVKEIDVGCAAPLLAVGGDHLVLVPEVLVEVPRLEPGVRRKSKILDPVIGGVFSVSLGHFW